MTPGQEDPSLAVPAMPPRGLQAWADGADARHAPNRAAQLGLFALLAVGSQDQREAHRQDAADLGVPRLGDEGSLQGLPEPVVSTIALDLASDHVAGHDWVPGERPMDPDATAGLRAALDAAPTTAAVCAYAYVNLDNPHDVERAMAGAAVAAIVVPPAFRTFVPLESAAPRAFSALTGCLDSPDPLAAEIAATALGGAEAPGARAAPAGVVESPISIAVHGTWSRLVKDRWYAPESGLHRLIRTESSVTELYTGDDYFRWSGTYREDDRERASAELLEWQRARGRIRVAFSHSHGGNVVLGAIDRGLEVSLLVLMHTPVLPRRPESWQRVRERVGRTLVMRSRGDPVVIADGLRTGSTPRPDASVLPHREIVAHWADVAAWFDHGLFVREQTWRDYRVAREVDYELGGLPVPRS